MPRLSSAVCAGILSFSIASTLAAQSYSFTHFAGTTGGASYRDGVGTAARLTLPQSVAVDKNGNVFVGENDTLRRISASGNVTTLAGKWHFTATVNGQGGSARFYQITGVVADSLGNIFVSDSGACVIRKVSPSGFVTDFAGATVGGSCSTVDGLGTAARLYYPRGLAIDSADNIYFCQSDHVIRKVTPGGSVTTIAGTPSFSGSVDGTGPAARFYNPLALAVDSGGNIFVADTYNFTIRKITPGGVVTTFAGTAGIQANTDGTGASARFSYPWGIAIDATDTMYEVDYYGQGVRRITSNAVVTTIVGTPNATGYVDATGSNARFNYTFAIASDRAGNLFVADTYNNAIRKVSQGNVVTTFAGLPPEKGVVDAAGAAARFKFPRDITTDSGGNIYVTDETAEVIRKITPAGVVSTFAGTGVVGGADGVGTVATFAEPIGIASDLSGNIYVADSNGRTVRKISPAAVVTTLAGTFGASGHLDGTGSAARFVTPHNLVVDPAGIVYLTDFNDHTIRKITAGGVVTTVAGNPGACGSADGTGNAATFCGPTGIAIGAGGDLFVSDYYNHTIRRVTTAGVVTTFAGTAGAFGDVDNTGPAARLYNPRGVTADATGTLFVTENSNYIRKITAAAVVTTINGLNSFSYAPEAVDGTGSEARTNSPDGITMTPSGNLYLVSRDDATVYLVRPAISDVAVVTSGPPTTGVATQLDTSVPPTATAWTWSVLRRPTGSVANLSSTSVRNPTFTPDIADVYTFLLKAESGSGARYSTVDILPTGSCTSPLSPAITISLTGASSFCGGASGGTASITSVTGGQELTYRWGYRTVSLGAITDIPGANSSSYVLQGADLGGSGTRFIVVTIVPGCGFNRISNEITVTVQPTPSATITAPSTVPGLSTGNTASIPDAGIGATYSWTITGGTITAGAATRTITFSARNSSPVTLNVTVTASGCSRSSSKIIAVNELPYTFLHLAGTTGGAGSVDGAGASARLRAPNGIVVDRDGTIYFSDAAGTIRKLYASGNVSTLAGLSELCGVLNGTGSAARLNCFGNIGGLTIDSAGNLFVMDGLRVRKITPAGAVSLIAGSGSNGSADGTGAAASFRSNGGLTIDSSGNIYLADSNNHSIRKITAAGVVTTFAGLSGSSGAVEGTGSAARFTFPRGLGIDSSDNVYVADGNNHVIRRITPAGAVTTFAGTLGAGPGSVDGPVASARFSSPAGVVVDAAGTVYVVELSGHRIRRIVAGVVSTLAGQLSIITGYADGTGSAAQFNGPNAIAIEPGGSVVVSDTSNNTIRRVTPAGVVTTIAGLPAAFGSTDATGASAVLNTPFGLSFAADGSVYFSDQGTHVIRRVTAAGVVTTIAGLAGSAGTADGNGSAARFNAPAGLTVDGSGNIYVCDRSSYTIRRITPAGDVTTIAGQPGTSGSADGTGSAARFNLPTAIVIDSFGDFLIADRNNHTIRKMTAAGVVTTVAGTAGSTGLIDGTGSAARFNFPIGLAIDATGNLFVADFSNNAVRKVTSGGVVTTVATGSGSGSAQFPSAIAVDGGGDLFVASTSDFRVVKLPAVSASANTIGGDLAFSGAVDGTGTLARLRGINSMIVDFNGALYLADGANHAIRVARPTPLPDLATGGGSIAAGSTASLDTTPVTATTWSWTIVRRPAGSAATFSNATLRNPTFTPDMPDLYTLMVRADNIAGTRFSTINLNATGTCSPTLSAVTASLSGAASFCSNATGGTASAAVAGGADVAYRWGWRSASLGPITDIKGANSRDYVIRGADLSGSGIKYLVVTVTPSCGAAPMVSNEIILSVLAAPDATITAPASVNGFSAGNIASVPNAGGGASYVWNITNATITAGTGTRQITFTATNYGPINLDVTVTAGGCPNSSSTSIPIASAPYTFEHLAGTIGGPGYFDGSGTAPRFFFPRGIAMDSNGVMYIPDANNYTIRTVSRDGAVRTLAGLAHVAGNTDGTGAAARFNYPIAAATDSSNNVYVAANAAIRKITPAGVVTTLAGTSGSGGTADGTGAAARFNGTMYGMVCDAAGNVYVSDSWNYTIRKITPAGVVTTLAGTAGSYGEVDGTGPAARFYLPMQLAIDGAGTLYVADYYGHTIRSISPAGVVTTVGGSGGNYGYVDGPVATARFSYPEGIAVDPSGNLYISENGNGRIRKISSGIVTTIAGGGSVPGFDGVGSVANFEGPTSLVRDRNGDLYVVDGGTNIRKVTPAGVVSTFAGEPVRWAWADGTGAAARFDGPQGIVIDGSGNVVVADTNNQVIRRVTPAGVATTFAGTADIWGGADGTGAAASFAWPLGIGFDSGGNLYIANTGGHTIVKITPAAVVTTIAGSFGAYGSLDATGSAARFKYPRGLAVDVSGNIYVCDTDNHVIRKVTPAGVVTTVAGSAGLSGLVDGTGSAARFYGPQAVVIESTGNLLVGDTNNQRIRRVTPAGVVTTLAPTDPLGNPFGNLRAVGLALDGSGSLFIVDSNSHVVRRMSASGVVLTIGGIFNVAGANDGSGAIALFNTPTAIAVDSTGETLYIAEYGSSAIRVGKLTHLVDTATTSASTSATGTPVQLDTSPQTATGWNWTVIRQPAGGVASPSSSSIRNPTFTPDVGDLSTIMVRASGASGVRYSTVDVTGTGACTPSLTGAVASLSGASSFCATGSGGTASVATTGGGALAYRWGWRATSGGAITDIGGANGPSYVVRGSDMGGTGARFLVVTVVPACGAPIISNEISLSVTAAPNVTITAPALVAANSTGWTASIPDAGGAATYAWTISTGQITSGAASRQITFSAGNATPIILSVSVTVGACTNSSSTSVTVSTLPYTFSVLAGTIGGSGTYDGPVASARLLRPLAVATDRNGNTYVSDSSNTIRRISAAGIVSTLAGLAGSDCALIDGARSAARFCYPEGLVADDAGNLFVADTYQNAIRKITPDGVVTTVAGSGAFGVADGTGAAAQFAYPYGITIIPAGTLFVADFWGHSVRQVTPAGVVTTLAGGSGVSGYVDGTGAAARFNQLTDITNDGAGNLYVADYLNHSVRRVTLAGVVTTLAGSGVSGYADGTGAAALFNAPTGVAVEPSGNIAVSDAGNYVVRRITPAGVTTTVAGMQNSVGYENGPAAAARFNYMTGIHVTALGVILVPDYWNHEIRAITGGNVSTLAGAAAAFGSTNATGLAATFHSPHGVGVDASGNLFVADTDNNVIRKITPAGAVTTFAGTPNDTGGSADGTGPAASFFAPRQVAVDSAGNLFVSDWKNNTIRKITPAGVVTTFAGIAGVAGYADGGPGVSTFNWPVGIAVDSAGFVYVTDYNNFTIRKITPAGVVSTLAGLPGSWGFADGNGSTARFNGNHGIAVDSAGNVYVADAYNYRIRKITPAGDVSTLAGLGAAGWVDGPRTIARFDTPTGVAVDSSGIVYVADRYNHRIRKVTPDGTVSTIAGQTPNGNADGTGNLSMVGDPSELAVDSNGVVYVADITNHDIHIGRATTLVDAATVNNPSPATNSTVNLDSTPQTGGTTYSWSMIRRSSASGADLSSASIRNPTFTPDIADIYTFLLRAENAGNVRYSTVDVTASGACPALSSATASVSGSASVCQTGTAGTATANTAGGAGLSYRWGYRNVSLGAITDIPLGNLSTYLISGSDFGGAGTKFLVVTVTPSCGSPIISNETTITIRPQLASVAINVSGATTVGASGTAGTATLTSTGGDSVTQQWGYRTVSGGAITNISGQTATSYLISGAHFPGAGTYFLVATATPGCGNVTTSNEITVTVTGGGVATSVVAAANASGTSVHLTWAAASGATSYDVMRSTGGGVFTSRGSTSSLFFDDAVTPNTAYLYRIHVTAGDSANAYAGTFVFSDAPLSIGVTPIREIHFTELRTAANAMRALASLGAASFTDLTLSNTVIIKRIHLIEIRDAVDQARAAMVVAPFVYGEPTITAGTTTIKASQIDDLRDAVH